MKVEKKRVGIFLIYDADGIVDRYVEYLLKDICTCLDRLFIISNGNIKECELGKLRDISKDVYFRENRGYDAGAFKDAILNIVGLDILLQYDELTIFNDTFFGPFIPFREIYSEMDGRNVDMWGMTRHEDSFWGVEHIQSFFLVFTKRLLHSQDFKDFWTRLNGNLKTHDDLVREYEIGISQTFRDLGYTLSAYVDDRQYDAREANRAFNHYEHIGYQMLEYCKMPVMKKKKLSGEWKSYASYDDVSRSIDYIREHTNYDEDMIWESIIRAFSPQQLYQSLNLNYVLSTSYSDGIRGGLVDKALVICLIEDPILLSDTVLHFLREMPDDIHVCVITKSTECYRLLAECQKKNEVSITLMRLDDGVASAGETIISQLEQMTKGYNLICFINDSFSGDENYLTRYMKTMNRWGNMLNGRHLISNIIHLFNAQKRLGILLAPQLYYSSDYEWPFNHPWGDNYDVCKTVGESLGISALIENSHPFYDESGLWCRAEVARTLIQCLSNSRRDIKNQAGIKRALAQLSVYVAKGQGYYSAICESDENTRISMTNKNRILARMQKQYSLIFSDEGDRFLLLDEESVDSGVIEYCTSFESVFIYGMGKRGKHLGEYLLVRGVDIIGFLSSKSYELPVSFINRNTYYLSDVCDIIISGKSGLVIAVSRQFHSDVIRELQECGVEKYKWV